MKRLILSIALVAISGLMITSMAKNKDNELSQKNDKKEWCKCDKMQKSKHKKAPRFNPFEGITLSDAQKEQLKLKSKERKENIAKLAKERLSDKKDKKEMRKNMRKQHLNDMKEILTHEQYVMYLENLAMHQPKIHKRLGQKGHRSPHK